jgi:predicted MPP superfamily phosphohydrolase
MRLLFVADLHYSLKQFDWLLEQAGGFDVAAIGGDLLDLSSALDPDVQIAIVEKYLGLLRRKTKLLVCSGNHDGDRIRRGVAAVRTDRWTIRGR